MPAPERGCKTCRHYKPYGGSQLLEDTFGKCVSPRKPNHIQFAETLRGDPKLCGPDALWLEPLPPKFEVLDEEPRAPLDWEDPEDEV